MRFTKILYVCLGLLLLASATTHHGSAGAAKPQLKPFIVADGDGGRRRPITDSTASERFLGISQAKVAGEKWPAFLPTLHASIRY